MGTWERTHVDQLVGSLGGSVGSLGWKIQPVSASFAVEIVVPPSFVILQTSLLIQGRSYHSHSTLPKQSSSPLTFHPQ